MGAKSAISAAFLGPDLARTSAQVELLLDGFLEPIAVQRVLPLPAMPKFIFHYAQAVLVGSAPKQGSACTLVSLASNLVGLPILVGLARRAK